MRSLATALCATLLLALTPLVLASDHGHHEHGGPEPHVRVLTSFDLDGQTYYVVDDHGATQLWKETNGLAFGGQPAMLGGGDTGLQIETVCFVEEEGAVEYAYDEEHGCPEGVPVEADARVTNSSLLAEAQKLLP